MSNHACFTEHTAAFCLAAILQPTGSGKLSVRQVDLQDSILLSMLMLSLTDGLIVSWASKHGFCHAVLQP